MKTYQYAVTQHRKVLTGGGHSHIGPGIYFKYANLNLFLIFLTISFRYDFSGLGVEVVEYRENITSLLTRLAGILGGIFASSGIMASIITLMSSWRG